MDLTKVQGHVDEAALAAVFDQLKAIPPEFLVGKWKGYSFDSGHPTHQLLGKFKWAGKDFHSVENVDPIMVYDDKGARKWFADYGHARVPLSIVLANDPSIADLSRFVR